MNLYYFLTLPLCCVDESEGADVDSLLHKTLAAEEMTGDNKYFCDVCHSQQAATMQVCVDVGLTWNLFVYLIWLMIFYVHRCWTDGNSTAAPISDGYAHATTQAESAGWCGGRWRV